MWLGKCFSLETDNFVHIKTQIKLFLYEKQKGTISSYLAQTFLLKTASSDYLETLPLVAGKSYLLYNYIDGHIATIQ